ncbi:unnamed protein product [Trichogramma brassicae]|uniref:Uncharacterized protein n=1 Tax=Trichogramma brassicae TaxID=86971 RepID=A0A6H5IE95_9HYME|nr:unnamed protein product [Trichogramma brassicae]
MESRGEFDFTASVITPRVVRRPSFVVIALLSPSAARAQTHNNTGTMNQQNEAAGPTDKAFDIFRQPILQNGGNKRSTERYEFPPDLSRLSFGRGRNTPATTPQRNENRRPGDRAGSSDMSLDQSAMLDNPLNSAIIENPGATGLEALGDTHAGGKSPTG